MSIALPESCPLPVWIFKGRSLSRSDTKGKALIVPMSIDLLVEGRLVLEIKAVDKLLPIHDAQLLTYLKLGGDRTGLLPNFNVPRLKDGLKRLVL